VPPTVAIAAVVIAGAAQAAALRPLAPRAAATEAAGCARFSWSDAEAKAKLIRDMLKSGEPIESSDVLNSELIRRLSEQCPTISAP
jgi:hypothetical protein